MEASCLHLHPALLASKAGWGSWSSMVAYMLLPGSGLRSNWEYRRVPSTGHQVRTIDENAEYMYENVGCVQVASPVEYGYMNI